MSGRDPRVTPRAGDCIRLADQTRYIHYVDPVGSGWQYVQLARDADQWSPTYALEMAQYCRWAAGAEVLRVAEKEEE